MYIYGATVQGSGLSGVEYVASSVIIHPCDYSPNVHPLIADRKSTQYSGFFHHCFTCTSTGIHCICIYGDTVQGNGLSGSRVCGE